MALCGGLEMCTVISMRSILDAVCCLRSGKSEYWYESPNLTPAVRPQARRFNSDDAMMRDLQLSESTPWLRPQRQPRSADQYVTWQRQSQLRKIVVGRVRCFESILGASGRG